MSATISTQHAPLFICALVSVDMCLQNVQMGNLQLGEPLVSDRSNRDASTMTIIAAHNAYVVMGGTGGAVGFVLQSTPETKTHEGCITYGSS